MDVDGRKNTFQELHHKVEATITSWKFNHLNLVGKLILINNILIAYASHMMATYILPKKVLKNITFTLLGYWWKSSKGKKPIYRRKREVLEEHKHNGGVGLKNLSIMNQTTLFKKAWRINQNNQLLVSKIFRAKYSPNWFTKSMHGKLVEGCRTPLNAVVEIRTIMMDILLLLDKFSLVILFHVPRSKVNFAHLLGVEARKERLPVNIFMNSFNPLKENYSIIK